MSARATITIKSRPRADGGVSWFLWIRRPRPERDELIPVEHCTRPEDRPLVEEFAKPYREALRRGLAEPKHETADEWYDRFVKSRMGKVSTAATDHRQWNKHIAPILGGKAMVRITPDDVEAVRDHLNRQIDAWEAAGRARGTGLAFHTAANVWAILTTAMKHASTRKGDRALRVREAEGNPCVDIPPPRRGRAKRRHWCRSAWLNAALTSPANDHALKEAVAIGVGLHLRPGELHELRVRDLDLDAGEVRVHRSYDEDGKRVKGGTKTDEGVRTVTIPAWLAPLLKRAADERAGDDRVAPWVAATPEDQRAEAFRAFLRAGGAAPGHIFEDSETHEMIDFRSVRDTGVTLRFLAGERAEVIQREAGHRHISTTLGYAKEVANKGGRYGDAALTLPIELVGAAREHVHMPASAATSTICTATCEPIVICEPSTAESFEQVVARVGFEPTTFGL